jgi:hypothetical protein
MVGGPLLHCAIKKRGGVPGHARRSSPPPLPHLQFLTLTPDLSEGRSSDGKLLHTDVAIEKTPDFELGKANHTGTLTLTERRGEPYLDLLLPLACCHRAEKKDCRRRVDSSLGQAYGSPATLTVRTGPRAPSHGLLTAARSTTKGNAHTGKGHAVTPLLPFWPPWPVLLLCRAAERKWGEENELGFGSMGPTAGFYSFDFFLLAVGSRCVAEIHRATLGLGG